MSWSDDEKESFSTYVEEECEWYEEEVPSYNSSSYFTLRNDGNSCEQIYEEDPPMFNLVYGQMYSGEKPKEPLQYFLDYCALKD